MNVNDILGLGKMLPIDKLIEVVSNSVGRLSKPYFDRKDIDTKAYEIKKLAEARADEMKIISNAVKENFLLTGGIEYKEEKLAISSPKESPQSRIDTPSLSARTNERVNHQEQKKQYNIESVTAFAAEELKDEKAVSDEPLDEDWTTRFFRIVEDVSTEEMQALWGRILAGEIKQPKTYSLRTLELIRNLSRAEANTITKVANYAISYSGRNYLFKGKEGKLLDGKYNISYGEIASMMEVGLIQPGEFVNLQMREQPNDSKNVYTSGNVVIITNVKANTPLQIPVHVFSTAGNELLKLVHSKPPFDYLKSFANFLKRENVEVKYGSILSVDGDRITHSQPLKEFDDEEIGSS